MALDDREDPEDPEPPVAFTAPTRSGAPAEPVATEPEPEPEPEPAPEPTPSPEPEIKLESVSVPDQRSGPVTGSAPHTEDAHPEPLAEPEDPEERPALPVIEVQGLRKDFAHRTGMLRRRTPVRAIEDISFAILPGEAVGYVGPRGVGKTTLVELLTGVLNPTAGTILTCGVRPAPGSAAVGLANRIGVVFGDRSQLWPDLSLSESLQILASIHGLPHRRWVARRTELVERLGLLPFLDRPIGQLSADQRIRGEIAAALQHEPELVVLDEPTAGLDAAGKEQVRNFLRQEHRVHGRTLLITSSQISDVSSFCERLLIADRGRLAYDGDLSGLIDRAQAQRVLVVDLNQTDLLLDDVPGTRLLSVEAGGLRQRLSFSAGTSSTARVLADVASRARIRDLTLVEPPIEDVVRRLAAY
jgi:ABC-2 type transport system ATP-binding protein